MRRGAGSVCGLSGTAAAQDFPDQSHFQKVTLNDRPGEPMSLAVLPDGRVLHAARTGEIRLHDPRTGTNNIVTDMKAVPSGSVPARRGGRAGHRHGPELRREPLGLRLLLAEAEHAERRARHRHQRGRRAREPAQRRGSRAARAVQRLRAAVAVQVRDRPARLLDRAGDPPGQHVARHLLPRRRPDRLRRRGQPLPVDGRRHEPVPVGGLLAARRPREPQPGVRRPAHVRGTRTTCAASCCASAGARRRQLLPIPQGTCSARSGAAPGPRST